MSPANGWYVGKIVSATGAASYADSVDLNVPVDTGYRIYVYYRATTGDPWGIYGCASGTVNVTAGFSAISVTAPTGTTSQAQGSSLPVGWTPNASVATGEFSIWVVSPANGWYVGKIVAADLKASYVDSVDLNVPVDTGYKRLRLLPRHLRRPLGHLRDEPGHGERDRHRPQRHQRDRAHGHDQQGPGRQPAGDLDAQLRGRLAASSASGW